MSPLVGSSRVMSCASLSALFPPGSVASLFTETLPLLAVTFITENSLVAAVSPGGDTGWVLCLELPGGR